MTYTYTVSYEGNISTSLDERDYTFTIYNIWDNDGNNFSELLYFRKRMKDGVPNIESVLLDDSDFEWDWDNFLSPRKGDEIHPILPIYYNATYNVGLNWSSELYIINATFTNYSVKIISNRVEISHWGSGVDIDTGAPYFTDELIIWDYSTGWLISYEMIYDIKEPLSYILTLSIDRKQEGSGINVDISYLIGLIGIILGITGIVLGSYILYRFRRYSSEEYPSYEEPSEPEIFTD